MTSLKKASTLDVQVGKYFSQFERSLIKGNEAVAAKAKRKEFFGKLARKYGFCRCNPTTQHHPTAVISMDQFTRNIKKYLPRIRDGVFGFPVGLDFMEINNALNRMNNRTKGYIFEHSFSFGRELYHNDKAFTRLKYALIHSGVSRNREDAYSIYMHPFNFLSSHDAFLRFTMDQKDLPEKQKEEAVKFLQLSHFVYLTALEVAGTTRIRDPMDLFKQGTRSRQLQRKPSRQEAFKDYIKDSLLANPKEMSFEELQKLIPISNVHEFRNLAAERTAEIFKLDAKNNGLTSRMGDKLSKYSVGQSLLMACYFARNIIERYEDETDKDDGIKRVLSGIHETRTSGKCADFAGLAAHYLNQFIVPLNPKRYENWMFGVQRDPTWKHVYLKAINILPDKTVDVYFLEPTALANNGIKAMRTPREIANLASTKNHPVYIARTAENLMCRKIIR